MSDKVSLVIPARLESTRLPGKVLCEIGGKPMLQWVWNQASKLDGASEVVIATDSEEVLTKAEAWGAQVMMTSPECASGSERIASIIGQLSGDFVLNIQGDEPFIAPELLQSLITDWQQNGGDLVTAAYRIESATELTDPNKVKVVRSADGRALYFSRSTMPHVRGLPTEEWIGRGQHFVHIGLYGYARGVLEHFYEIPESPLETLECLEQLRFLEAGYSIRCIETAYRPLGVDTEEDLIEAQRHALKL